MCSIEKGNVNAVNLLVRENFDKDLTDFLAKPYSIMLTLPGIY